MYYIKQMTFYMINNLMLFLIILISILVSVAFFTLFERKVLSYIHYRKGPNKVSLWGLLQPFSDAMKLLSKEFFYPMSSNYLFYLFTPIIMFILVMSFWLIIPIMTNFLTWNLNSLFFLCLMSMGIYSLMISGWASNSSFSMIGAMRSIAQSISYEVTFAISFLLILFMINTLNLNMIMKVQKYNWLLIMTWPINLILFMSMLAEVNRTPFDLSEGESELVSGFNVEYSSYGFVLIFLSEYSSIMFMMYLFSMLSFSYNMFNLIFYFMLLTMLFLMIWIRTTLPRIRYDYLMNLCWSYLLPLILILYIYYIFIFKLMIDLNNF